ncbi:LPXTG cell wall anchor domain-containing protein [Candidatus Woesearchaeota archaeon]|nr:LPXTG cell wall anchor domain-containing protein [Candidatus Woesearchaeota archaeon]
MKKTILILIFSLFLVQIVSAATISGTVYDFSLKKINNVIIEINTQPMQRQIVKEGSYSFEVQKGSYAIVAKTADNIIIAKENIIVSEEGKYNLDLIGFIDISEEEELANDTNIDINGDIDVVEPNNNYWLIISIVLIMVLIFGLFYYKKRKKAPEVSEEITDDLTEKILDIMKKEQGRITQKELRKKLPYSEAKISLVLTELEAIQKIEKIKKGRSNVIIIKK